MDQIKIGKFISACRKNQKLTQAELAEKLGITDRAVSKWETGKSMPDSSIMLTLCEILKINVTDLLYGEVVTMDNYKNKTEDLLIEMKKQKEDSDKKLLSSEIFIGTFAVIVLLSFTFAASFFTMPDYLRIILIAAGFVICLIGLFYALRLEQVAGYYECRDCKHRYVPDYKSVCFSMHINRTRYMKCPECGKKTWQKKVVTKD